MNVYVFDIQYMIITIHICIYNPDKAEHKLRKQTNGIYNK